MLVAVILLLQFLSFHAYSYWTCVNLLTPFSLWKGYNLERHDQSCSSDTADTIAGIPISSDGEVASAFRCEKMFNIGWCTIFYTVVLFLFLPSVKLLCSPVTSDISWLPYLRSNSIVMWLWLYLTLCIGTASAILASQASLKTVYCNLGYSSVWQWELNTQA